MFKFDSSDFVDQTKVPVKRESFIKLLANQLVYDTVKTWGTNDVTKEQYYDMQPIEVIDAFCYTTSPVWQYVAMFGFDLVNDALHLIISDLYLQIEKDQKNHE